MQSNLYIPKKLHVGFVKRDGTYNGQLAYAIYEDEKGVLRKKASWDTWRDESIPHIVIDNVPARFIFNKGVQRHGYFGSGRSVMRVYDTRGFEFEISIENLVGILMHSDISKRDILEECVLAWYGKDLVLLPINSEEYKSSVEFTDKQSLKVSTKDLVKGYLYEKKKSDGHLMYMGYHEFYDRPNYKDEHKHLGKKHIFYDLSRKKFVVPSPATIAQVILEEVHSEFAEINTKLYKSYHLNELSTFDVEFGKSISNSYDDPKFYKKNNDEIIKISYNRYYGDRNKIKPDQCYLSKSKIIKNGKELSLDFKNLKTNNLTDIAQINDIFKEIGLDWCVSKDNNSFYNSFTVTGSELSTKEFVEILKNSNFGNKLIVVDVNNQKNNW